MVCSVQCAVGVQCDDTRCAYQRHTQELHRLRPLRPVPRLPVSTTHTHTECHTHTHIDPSGTNATPSLVLTLCYGATYHSGTNPICYYPFCGTNTLVPHATTTALVVLRRAFHPVQGATLRRRARRLGRARARQASGRR
eukprot:1776697-Rhodomonas_salina.2